MIKKLLSVFLFAVSVTLSAAELLPDPDFSAAKAGASAPEGWSLVTKKSPSAIVEQAGKKHLEISSVNAGGAGIASRLRACRVGEKLTLEADVSGSGRCRMAVYLFTARGKFAGTLLKTFQVNGRKTLRHVFTVPAEFKGKVPGKNQFRLWFFGKDFKVYRISAVNDVAAPDGDFLKKAIASALKGSGRVELPPKKLAVSSITVPRGVTLCFSPGSSIEFLPGSVMTLNGKVESANRQIFSGDARFQGTPEIPEVYPQWFGAKGDGRNNDAPALQQAADLAKVSVGRKLVIPSGRYRVEEILKLSCNVDAHGVLVIPLKIDPGTRCFPNYAESFRMKKNGSVIFVPDVPEIALDPEPFYGIRADQFFLPVYRNIAHLADPGKKCDLEPGGTLRIFSTDFFTSRKVGNADHVYEPTDIFEIVSPRGEVFPESCFDYVKRTDAPEWSKDKVYKRGDYVKRKGEIFKASYPSGPGVVHKDRFRGEAAVGPADPADPRTPRQFNVKKYPIKYSGGKKGTLMIWRKLAMRVHYTPPQVPLTVNDLAVEVVLEKPVSKYVQVLIKGGVFSVQRSHVTLNNLRVENKERFLRVSSLVANRNCVSLTYNNARISGACDSSGGYNCSNVNVGNVTYNNCISTNCRDSLSGRHGKRITVNGGYFGGVIDDHYGKGYYINNAVLRPVEPWIPGYYTPKARPQEWFFKETCAIRVNGSDFTIENCRVFGGSTLLLARQDVGDIGGRIVIRNISVKSQHPFVLFRLLRYSGFDYAHNVPVPHLLSVENVTNEGPGGLSFFGHRVDKRWSVMVSNCRDIVRAEYSNADMKFRDCTFRDPVFKFADGTKIRLESCTIKGKSYGADHKNMHMNGCITE